jgi:methylenetetrahydrofolate reductase (NADPH)
LIKDHVDAVNVTDNQTSVTRLCSLAACIRIKLMGEPVLQMVTRDRNRIALQSDILGAASFGINTCSASPATISTSATSQRGQRL